MGSYVLSSRNLAKNGGSRSIARTKRRIGNAVLYGRCLLRTEKIEVEDTVYSSKGGYCDFHVGIGCRKHGSPIGREFQENSGYDWAMVGRNQEN